MSAMNTDRTDRPNVPMDQRIPLRVTGTTKNQLQILAREKGTDVNKLIRRAIRRELERIQTDNMHACIDQNWKDTVVNLCPACGAWLHTTKGEPVQWHVHDGIEAKGDMLW